MDEDQVDESPLSPDSLALVLSKGAAGVVKSSTNSTNSGSSSYVDEALDFTAEDLKLIKSNIFRKESNGEPMEFYFRKARIFGREDNKNFVNRLEVLKTEIQKCGGTLAEGPLSGHSIELAFPELFPDVDEVDEDLFKVEFVKQCVEQMEFLNLEDYRIGKSPYDGSIKIHDIIHGHQSWNSVHRTESPRPEGRKLPDFGPKIEGSLLHVKKKRCDYTRSKDVQILKYLVEHKLYNKTGGMEIWREIEKNLFPEEHTFQSLQTHFRKYILPNLFQFKEIPENDRKLFTVGSVPSTSFAVRPLPPLREPESNSGKAVDVGLKARVEKISDLDDSENQEPVDATILTQIDVEMKENENPLPTVQELPSHRIDQVEDMETDKNESTDASLSPRLVLKRTSSYFTQPSNNDSKPTETVTLFSDKHSTPKKSQRYKPSGPVSDEVSSVTSVSDESTDVESEEDNFASSRLSSKSKVQKGLTKKTAGKPYTRKEDEKIINFIRQEKRFDEVRGKRLWLDMTEGTKLERTWQSLKNRYIKTISLNLKSYITDSKLIRKFKAGKEAERNLGGRRTEAKHEKSKREKKPLRITERSPKNDTDDDDFLDDSDPHEGPSKETVRIKNPAPPSKPKTPVKHPALLPVTQKTPVKQSRIKLYSKHPVLATFTPRSSPIAIPKEKKAVPEAIIPSARNRTPLKSSTIDSDPLKSLDEQPSLSLEDSDSATSKVKSACGEQLSIKEMVKKFSGPKLRPCSVLLQRLPETELKKYGL